MVKKELGNIAYVNSLIEGKRERKRKCQDDFKELEGFFFYLFGDASKEVFSPRRDREFVYCRYALYFALKDNGHGWSAIGLAMKRHHATIMHGVDFIVSVMDMVNNGYADKRDREWTLKAKLLSRRLKQINGSVDVKYKKDKGDELQ